MNVSIALFVLPVAVAGGAAPAVAPVKLQLAATHALPGVKGRIDHLAVDTKHHRLFVAALGNDSVEVVDTAGTQSRSVAGFAEPQGAAYVAATNQLFVANGEAGRIDILDAASLRVVKRIDGLDDADNVRYDAVARRVLVGYGKGALATIDADNGQLLGRIDLPGHPESFQLERGGARAFVNVPSAHKVVVIDRAKQALVASWDVPNASRNFPMALDEAGRRLFVGARSPAVMLVYDVDSGKVVARVPIGGDTDDIFFDAESKRVYAICGDGRIDVIRADAGDRYVAESSVATAPRARTGLLVPEEHMLYVAAPADGATPARILAYRLR